LVKGIDVGLSYKEKQIFLKILFGPFLKKKENSKK
jgi:hypothetical protein